MSILRGFLSAAILVLGVSVLPAEERFLDIGAYSPLGDWVYGGEEPPPPGVYVGVGRDMDDWGYVRIDFCGEVYNGDRVYISAPTTVALLDYNGGWIVVGPGQTVDWPAEALPLGFYIEGYCPSSGPCDGVISVFYSSSVPPYVDPVELYVTVVEVINVEWPPADDEEHYGDPNLTPDNPESHGGGWRLIPDAGVKGGPSHQVINCRAVLNLDVPGPNCIPVHFKALDVDDPTQDSINLDPNPADPEDRPCQYYGYDNRKGQFEPGLGLWPDIDNKEIGYGAKKTVCTFWLYDDSMCPGNNFKIFATTDRKWRADAEVNPTVQNGLNSVNSIRNPENGTPPNYWSSPLLSIWRRLHVEKDSMGAPPPGFDGWDDDDDLLRDVDLPDPDTSALADAFYAAYIEVVFDGVNDQSDTTWHYNFNDDGPAERTYLRNNRQTEGNAYFWVAYVATTYEGHLPLADNDPDEEVACLAWSWEDYPNVAAVYEEIIRDVAAQWGWSEGLKDLVRALVSLHEVGHQFALDDTEELYNCMWAHNSDSQEAIIPEVAGHWFRLEDINTIRHHWNLPFSYP
jgi:hypothetical protein